MNPTWVSRLAVSVKYLLDLGFLFYSTTGDSLPRFRRSIILSSSDPIAPFSREKIEQKETTLTRIRDEAE